VQKKLITEFPDKGWALSSLKKLLNYLNVLPACFASFFFASRDEIALKNFRAYHFRYHDI